MPGLRLTNRELLEKLRNLLKQKYGRIHYLGRIINYVNKKIKEELSEEINILLQANRGTPIGAVLAEEDYQWLIKNEPKYLWTVKEPYQLEFALDLPLGEYVEQTAMVNQSYN